MTDQSNPDRDQTVSEAAEELTRSVTNLVGAAFGVGAAVAKTAAEATAGGRPVANPKTPQGPLNLIMHYGLTAAANLVRTVITTTAAGSADGASASVAQPASAAAARPPGSGPTVTVGSTLRIPLSIENPGSAPMEMLQFSCTRVDALNVGHGQKLGVANLRFAPANLSIAPRDFEKLTVFVDTTSATALGTYRVVIGVATANLESVIEFDVVEAVQA